MYKIIFFIDTINDVTIKNVSPPVECDILLNSYLAAGVVAAWHATSRLLHATPCEDPPIYTDILLI